MKKNLRKIVSLVLVLAMTLAISVPGFAADTHSQQNTSASQTTNSSQTFAMVPKGSLDQITPRGTFIGDGGWCTITWMSSGKYIHWEIGLNTTAVASFNGYMSVEGLTSPYASKGANLSGASGLVDCSNLPSGQYSAHMTGTAVGLDGNMYTVVPNATINFYKS